MTAAVAGATYVIHIASPLSGNLTTEEDYKPAVDGTMAVVRACSQHRVRRCVITSSIAACMNMLPGDKPDLLNESHWSVVEGNNKITKYGKSKTLAEKAAWDFKASLQPEQDFELVTILPGFVMGPPLRTEHTASVGFIKRLINGEMAEIKDDGCGVVDVRDVAYAHLAAIQKPAAAGHRFILVNFGAKFIEFAQPIIDKYVPLGWNVSQTKGVPNPDAIITQFDNTASREVLGVQYRDFTQTMVDMADKCVELGIVTKP
uniref:3-beta hydroxysteroid dehydrogenase/isomerase domain-containing protein n=1 Tax=Favella ehrenbergii TaxID=182087 RepID=A0A7S3HY17_9SPIT|mmetsp:Transcript_15946/g.21641  ORF Transcript_15946/g.21641 Transcript_15946/m.21641 type:complete len:260 (+) Transcript_15946:246-1025(+)